MCVEDRAHEPHDHQLDVVAGCGTLASGNGLHVAGTMVVDTLAHGKLRVLRAVLAVELDRRDKLRVMWVALVAELSRGARHACCG